MSKPGSRMIQSAEEALAFASGGATLGYVVHEPVDVRAPRRKLGLAQPASTSRYELSVGTVRDRERGRAASDEAARALLRSIEPGSEMARHILASGKATSTRRRSNTDPAPRTRRSRLGARD